MKKKKVKWLIEKNIFETEDKMLQIIEELGMEYHLFSYVPIACEIEKIPFSKNDCVVFYGSLNAAKVLQRKYSYLKPCVYGNFENYECSVYYPYYENFLLNRDRILLDYEFFKLNFDKLFQLSFARNNALFVRPDSGLKPFTGKVFFKEQKNECFEEVELYGDLTPKSKILVSSPKNIVGEWRFVITGNYLEDHIISGCQYRIDGKHEERNEYSDEAYRKLEQILKWVRFKPDLVWTADICQTEDNDFHLLEIGCFSCSGLYSIDLEKVIQEVSTISEAEFNKWRQT